MAACRSNVRSLTRSLNIVSFNMHGFNQGCVAIDELISSNSPDIFLVQEHCLTPANLHKFEERFSDYFAFGSTAMANQVESGMLRGRPYGGLMNLIKNDLHNLMQTIHSEERLTVVKVANYLLLNVYLPCAGTKDRLLICEDLLENLWSLRERFPDCECLIAGEFYADHSVAR